MEPRDSNASSLGRDRDVTVRRLLDETRSVIRSRWEVAVGLLVLSVPGGFVLGAGESLADLTLFRLLLVAAAAAIAICAYVYLILTVFAPPSAPTLSVARARATVGRIPAAVTIFALFALRLVPYWLIALVATLVPTLIIALAGGGSPALLRAVVFLAGVAGVAAVSWAFARLAPGVPFSIATKARNWDALDVSVVRYRRNRAAFWVARVPDILVFLATFLIVLGDAGRTATAADDPLLPRWLLALVRGPIATLGTVLTAALARAVTPETEILRLEKQPAAAADEGGGSLESDERDPSGREGREAENPSEP